MDELSSKIVLILDAATKVGVGLGNSVPAERAFFDETTANPVEYVLRDDTALKAQALKAAVASSEAIRSSLTASGVKTGKLIGVSLLDMDRSAEWGPFEGNSKSTSTPQATSNSPTELFIRAYLNCTYELMAD